jgi:hypothetical protein
MNSFTEILHIRTGNIFRMSVISLKHEQFHGNYIHAFGKHFMNMDNSITLQEEIPFTFHITAGKLLENCWKLFATFGTVPAPPLPPSRA